MFDKPLKPNTVLIPGGGPCRYAPARKVAYMNLTELKKKPAAEIITLAQDLKIEGAARARKQDIIFAILKVLAKSGEDISGDGVLEILQDGFGFLPLTVSPVRRLNRRI